MSLAEERISVLYTVEVIRIIPETRNEAMWLELESRYTELETRVVT